ncbi:hypothetical protein HIM_02900 [Hirsutella minnesotensis 3608]|nr:hypothetical protein HIM_02900 [Hirsutella minnesotensis 3608]
MTASMPRQSTPHVLHFKDAPDCSGVTITDSDKRTVVYVGDFTWGEKHELTIRRADAHGKAGAVVARIHYVYSKINIDMPGVTITMEHPARFTSTYKVTTTDGGLCGQWKRKGLTRSTSDFVNRDGKTIATYSTQPPETLTLLTMPFGKDWDILVVTAMAKKGRGFHDLYNVVE